MAVPQVEQLVPDVWAFVQRMLSMHEAGRLTDWAQLEAATHAFFAAERMDRIEATIPGWQKMAAYADSLTLNHVMLVFTALLQSPEYCAASAETRQLMNWTVLFHDLAKEVVEGQRDHVHGFRSAALAGRQLPGLGFPLHHASELEDWAVLTETAVTPHPVTGELMQDNRKLPAITAGIDRLFGLRAPAALIIKAVLLHLSVNVLDQWSQMNPLTEAEIEQYVDDDLYPLLKMMMLVDNDAWTFFDPAQKAVNRAETLAAFDRIAGNRTDLN